MSCNDLHILSSQAAKARNVHDIEFGGLSVLLAGDFGQLPPTTGAWLYDGRVGLRTAGYMDPRAQAAVFGRILWHMFNTVVILRENMRQREQTELDKKLRTALENMRFGACTADDIIFLRGRIAGGRADCPHLDDDSFRNVSIITALNADKDVINELGPERFAQDTGQELTAFYSVDHLSTQAVDRSRWKNCHQAMFKYIGPKLQKALWEAAPSTTAEQIPGCLKLCRGMPVMIKTNDATELCITKGQEATVVGWDSNTGPDGQKILDNLFLELVNPPRTVHIPGLPENVIPMTRTSKHVTTLLQDDSLLSLNREQVLILPNFSMTDYGSQGKSREHNVVHLNNCKDHKAYYVALSRGKKASTTVILQGFDERKITKGMSGYLRQ
ncbi:hypothetical protein C8R45DRAFT_827775, partial [Mycena sanguinolenta]